MNSISKIWMINLALIAAVLFVYGGLSWFDSKDPEAASANASQTANANVSFTQKLSNFFSFGGGQANNAQTNNGQNDESLAFGYAEDGTKLKLDNQDYEDNEGIFSATPEDHARLKTIEQDLTIASNELMVTIKVLELFPNSEQAKHLYENLQESIYALQLERDELQEKINNSLSTSDGL